MRKYKLSNDRQLYHFKNNQKIYIFIQIREDENEKNTKLFIWSNLIN